MCSRSIYILPGGFILSCANPFTTYHDYKTPLHNVIRKYYDVPCGYCLNCRKDKQNYYVDRANYEYCKRLTAAFVTFTYDDIHLLSNCAVLDGNGRLIYDQDNNGNISLRATLNYRDFTKYIDNIRHWIKNHPSVQCVLCQPDFSYLYCGEYGDCFGRPHFHVLFFGLDFAFCKDLLFESWPYGFIDVLPLLDGGIRYVCKYMDKQTFGSLAELQYDFKGLSRPRIRMSQGFGKGLFLNNLDDIVKNDFTYPCGKGMRRPISAYWKSLYTGNVFHRDKTKRHAYKLKNIAYTARKMHALNYNHRCNIFDEQIQRDFKLKAARNREYNMEIQIRNSGQPVVTFKDIFFNKFGHPCPKDHVIRSLDNKTLHLLVDQYRDSLPYTDIIPF